MITEIVLVFSTLLGNYTEAPDPIMGDILNYSEKLEAKLASAGNEDLLEFDEQKTESEMIQATVESLYTYNLIDSEYVSQLEEFFESDEDMEYTPDLNADFFDDIARNALGLSWDSLVLDDSKISIKDDLIDGGGGLVTRPGIGTLSSSLPSFGYLPGNGGGNHDDLPTLEKITDYDATESKVSFNEKISGKLFIGVKISRATCISIYNTIIGLLDYELWSNIAEALGFVSTVMGIMYESFPVAWAAVDIALTKIWAGIANIFTLIPSVVSTVLKVILIIVGVAVIAFLSATFVCGMNRKGFACGVIIHNIFKWEGICGPIDE